MDPEQHFLIYVLFMFNTIFNLGLLILYSNGKSFGFRVRGFHKGNLPMERHFGPYTCSFCV